MLKQACVRRLIWVLILTLTFSCSNDSSSPEADAFANLAADIKAVMERQGVPQLSAIITDKDGLIWQSHQASNGLTPPRSDALFAMGSISKLVTAVALMQLVEAGQVDLQADINQYLGFNVRNRHFPDSPITAFHLLTHNSGMASNPPGDVAEGQLVFEGTVDLDWIPHFLATEGQQSSDSLWRSVNPGDGQATSIQSSNMGVALVGALVEAVSGQDFGVYAKQEIFEPLGMQDSGFRLSDIVVNRLLALYGDSLNETVAPYDVYVYPAFSLKCSMPDLQRFLMAIMNGGSLNGNRILRTETVAQMLENQFVATNLPFSSSISLMWRQPFNQAWIGHTGGVPGASTVMDFHPQRGFGVIILTNQAGHSSIYPGGEIYNLIHTAALAN